MTNAAPTSSSVATVPEALATCEREPILHPGAVQPHGVLLVCRAHDLLVLQVSANAERLFARSVALLLGRRLGELLDGVPLALGANPSAEMLAARNPVDVVVAGRPYEAILHRLTDRVLVELEPSHPSDRARALAREAHRRLHHALARLRAARSTAELLAIAAEEVRALTGVDRALVYRFEPDEHGVVVAESRREGVTPYLGLHFPASDVPSAVRELYATSPLRLVPDARATPSRLVPALDPETRQPLDLRNAVLRAVAPVHCEYLENMGVRASMSISLMSSGHLWGLLACHHGAPHFVPYETRAACELFGEVVASQITLLEQRERADERARASERRAAVVREMSSSGMAAGLLRGGHDLLALFEATGVALVADGRVTHMGSTPPVEMIEALGRWVPSVQECGLYHTECLSGVHPLGGPLAEVASGILAVVFSAEVDYVIFLFRPERPRTLRWAGDPHVPGHDAAGARLGPRKSFAEWIETVRGRSEPWREADLENARELRTAILDVVVSKAAELARLNGDLRAAVRARDEFFSMASHELRTPLSTLELQLDGLAKLAQDAPELALGSERVGRSLSMERRQLTRLEQLVDEMLDLSRLSSTRLEISPQEGVDLCLLVREVVARFSDKLSKVEVRLVARGDLVGRWDRSRLDQVVTNLLSNAIKYGEGRPVTIQLWGRGERVVLGVRDRGVGLDAADRAALFTRFHRAPATARRYSGFGLGLWIVKQLVEAHGGTISVESERGSGTLFEVRLPRRAERRFIGAEA